MEEWQYGIASISFRWNLSGTYQQVLPRYISVDSNGTEREFLYDALNEASLGKIFLKGYQWPFDTRKLKGSSEIDLLVASELKAGRRVYLDYTRNPKGLNSDFSSLTTEAYQYLERSGALFGTPFERLMAMNPDAVTLYRAHGIDLATEKLEISVCAQHCNGGVTVDAHWQTEIKGLYCAGEAAGTFGVYRPGGSALNATQVGSLRAAEHIAKQPARSQVSIPEISLPTITYGESNLHALREALTAEMSRVADFDRSTEGMRILFSRVNALYDRFFTTAIIADKTERAALYRLYDMVVTQRAVLSAMILSGETIGTHGAGMVDRLPPKEDAAAPRTTRTLTRGNHSEILPVSPLPSPELWFETLLAAQARKREEKP
jgi:succinate dehydrogenase/fumarate reductase flavoprotein subunit